METEKLLKTFGVIYDLQRMCVNDGPGFRTTVFCKGCLLNCKWCHNPEGKRRYPEAIPFTSNCNKCGLCAAACPTGAMGITADGFPVIDRSLCTDCFQCVSSCKDDGLVVWGRIVTAESVMAEVSADKPFYKNSGGGLTVSGGEPMAQPDFVHALFSLCKESPDPEERIRTALDTCGHAPWASFEKIVPLTDLVLLDLKHMDSDAHRAYTGAGNEIILENARRIAAAGVPLRLRVPVIPGVNDTEENFLATARFAESLGPAVTGVDLLPYHPYAGHKYRAFGMAYDFPAGEGYDDATLLPVVEIFVEKVAEVTIGG
ncbi:MAG: glycyl-radical enzyme activating protein [Thermodesulfobacteriota bacterium]